MLDIARDQRKVVIDCCGGYQKVRVWNQIAFCSDKEILELAELQMPPKQNSRLSNLLQKQGAQDLNANEQKELWNLMELNRLSRSKFGRF